MARKAARRKPKRDQILSLTPNEAVAVLAGPFKAGAPVQKPKCDPRKASVYLPEAIVTEIHAEAKRQDRTFSWLVQRAWKKAREEIRKTPAPG